MQVRVVKLGGRVGDAAQHDLGPTCDLLIAEVSGATYTYMVDCGMGINDDAFITWEVPAGLQLLESLPKIDSILVSHVHGDHVTGLPYKLVTDRLKPNAKIICTRPTATNVSYMLHDTLKISRLQGKKAPYYTRDIHYTMKRVQPVMKPEVQELVPGAIWVLLWPAGHIRGACSFIFLIQEGKEKVKVMFSGDYATHDQLTTLGAPLPPDEWLPDVIASFDCTNGAVEGMKPWGQEMERMADDAHQTIKSGEYFFSFAFALERCQTFARKLADLGVTVWLYGPSAEYFAKKLQSPEGFWAPGDKPMGLQGVRIAQSTSEPFESGEPAAILAPSGMGHGPAVDFMVRLLPRKRAKVAGSGFVARGTNGFRVLHARRGQPVRLETNRGQVEVVVNAEREQYRPSSHSVREPAGKRIGELLRKSQFRFPYLGLAHAETKALDWFHYRWAGAKMFRSDRPEDRDIILVG